MKRVKFKSCNNNHHCYYYVFLLLNKKLLTHSSCTTVHRRKERCISRWIEKEFYEEEYKTKIRVKENKFFSVSFGEYYVVLCVSVHVLLKVFRIILFKFNVIALF